MEYTVRYQDQEFRVDSCENCHFAFFDIASGELTRHGTHFSCIPSKEELACWSEAIKPYVELWKERKGDLEQDNLYIRYGKIPKEGRSLNHRDGFYERGISAYHAKYALETGLIIFDDNESVNPTVLLHGSLGLYSDTLLILGKEISRGSDREPVLTNVNVLGTLEYDTERHGFVLSPVNDKNIGDFDLRF